MTERTFKNISIKTEFAEQIESFIRQNPQLGYRSIAAFLEDASRRRLEELKATQTELPRMEQVNFDDQGVKILDRKLQEVVNVYFRPEGVQCSYDKTDQCNHIDYALSLPNVKKVVAKKRKEGWKLPDI